MVDNHKSDRVALYEHGSWLGSTQLYFSVVDKFSEANLPWSLRNECYKVVYREFKCLETYAPAEIKDTLNENNVLDHLPVTRALLGAVKFHNATRAESISDGNGWHPWIQFLLRIAISYALQEFPPDLF